jgi:sulfite exporter TauE/SafE
MMGFGLGTMPALLALTVSAASIPLSLRMRLRRLTPAVLALTAALLLARALGPPASVPPQHPVPSAVAHH